MLRMVRLSESMPRVLATALMKDSLKALASAVLLGLKRSWVDMPERVCVTVK